MARVQLNHVALRGLVCTVPGEARDIRDLGAPFTADEVEKTAKTVGLRELFRVSPGQTAGDLSTAAAAELLQRLDWAPESVDALLMVTQTPDHFLPATACVAHGRLGLSDDCLAYDIGMGCSGYVYGLHQASQLIASKMCRRVILLAGDTISRTLAPEDKACALLFGDAGSATALEYDEQASPWSFVLGTDGKGWQHLIAEDGAFRAQAKRPGGNEEGRLPQLFMNGLEVFNFTLDRVPPLVREVLEYHGWSIHNLDSLVLHQANQMVLKKVQTKLGLSDSQVPININRFGNTSMVSIPLVLCDELVSPLRSTVAQDLAMVGFGVGFSWAAAAVTINPVAVASILNV